MLNKLKEISKRKTDFIESAEDKLLRRLTKLERVLVNAIFDKLLDSLTTDKGIILFNNSNINMLSAVDIVIDEIKKKEYLKIFNTHTKDYFEIGSLTNLYFKTQVTKSTFDKLEKKVKKVSLNSVGLDPKGNIKKGGFLDSLFYGDSFSTEIKRVVVKNINSGARLSDLRKELVNEIISTDKRNGLLKRYWRQNAFDTQQRFNRNYSNVWADEVGMTAGVYSAGTVRDSRIFCKDRVGKVFLPNEVNKWKKIVNKKQGKKTIGPIVRSGGSYNPKTDCGGINCQHTLDFISDDLAIDIDKTLELKDGKLVRV